MTQRAVNVNAILSSMPRKLRVQYPGAIYHLMNRGDRREDIFDDDQRLTFRSRLAAPPLSYSPLRRAVADLRRTFYPFSGQPVPKYLNALNLKSAQHPNSGTPWHASGTPCASRPSNTFRQGPSITPWRARYASGTLSARLLVRLKSQNSSVNTALARRYG